MTRVFNLQVLTHGDTAQREYVTCLKAHIIQILNHEEICTSKDQMTQPSRQCGGNRNVWPAHLPWHSSENYPSEQSVVCTREDVQGVVRVPHSGTQI